MGWCSASYDREPRSDLRAIVTRRRRAMGIRDKPIAAASSWQNGFAERLIGSIRRECVDHLVILGEAHLRRILQSYGHHYNDIRTHRSLNKDAPLSRPIQRTGVISSRAILGGPHHHSPVFKFSVHTAFDFVRNTGVNRRVCLGLEQRMAGRRLRAQQAPRQPPFLRWPDCPTTAPQKMSVKAA